MWRRSGHKNNQDAATTGRTREDTMSRKLTRRAVLGASAAAVSPEQEFLAHPVYSRDYSPMNKNL